MGGRSYYMAQSLYALGYDVTLISARYNHKLRSPKVFKGLYEIDYSHEFRYIRIQVPSYKNSFNKKRILNWFIFNYRLKNNAEKFGNKPDVVLVSSPSLVAFLAAEKIAKKFNAKLIFEVRDIWPLTLMETGNYSPKNVFIRYLQWIENRAYKVSDMVVSNLPFSWKHMLERGMDKSKFEWVANGVNLKEAQNNIDLSDDVYKKIPKDKFIIGYTGAIGKANNLNVLIDAADILKDYMDIFFILVGGGKCEEKIIKKITNAGLKNIEIFSPINKNQIQTFLSYVDICFIGWNDASVYEFGIGSNKLPEYLFSGKPIVHSYSGKGDIVEWAKAGISVPANNPNSIADAILTLKNMSNDDRKTLGENGKSYALTNHDYSILAKKLDKAFMKRFWM
jgi:glycosyltransferase involved in cell wall biosynthesis